MRKIQGTPPGIRLFLLYLSETVKSRWAPNQDFAVPLMESQEMSSNTTYPQCQNESRMPSNALTPHLSQNSLTKRGRVGDPKI